MNHFKQKIKLIGVMLLTVFLSACFNLQIKRNIKNPEPYFKEAHNEVEKIHHEDPERRGEVSCIHALVYSGSERKLIKCSVPLWIIDDFVDWDKEMDDEFDLDFDCRFDMDLKNIDDLSQFGPGLLVEIVGEEDTVLVWLE